MKDPEGLACQHCGASQMERMISRVAYHPTMQRVWETSGPPSANAGDDYYRDPRNIGRWTEQRLEQLGVDMPSEARKMIDAAREGDMPEPLKDL
jgi:hypothetical protein